jgi:pSer/pThr/pTyr-binding forkhead associated (FHA) protein
MKARLTPLNGGPSVDIVKDLTLFGRDDDCDVRLNHKSVSKLHCVIVKTDGLLLLRDLGSTNGTRVNGQRVRRAALLPNDQLMIANLKYQVRFGVELETELEAERANEPEPVAPNPPKIPLRRNALPDEYPDQNTPPT